MASLVMNNPPGFKGKLKLSIELCDIYFPKIQMYTIIHPLYTVPLANCVCHYIISSDYVIVLCSGSGYIRKQNNDRQGRAVAATEAAGVDRTGWLTETVTRLGLRVNAENLSK